jgi:hypothetical protein
MIRRVRLVTCLDRPDKRVLKRANHSIFQIDEQLGRILVGVDLQEPRVCLERVEHAGLPEDFEMLWVGH